MTCVRKAGRWRSRNFGASARNARLLVGGGSDVRTVVDAEILMGVVCVFFDANGNIVLGSFLSFFKKILKFHYKNMSFL